MACRRSVMVPGESLAQFSRRAIRYCGVADPGVSHERRRARLAYRLVGEDGRRNRPLQLGAHSAKPEQLAVSALRVGLTNIRQLPAADAVPMMPLNNASGLGKDCRVARSKADATDPSTEDQQ